VPAELGDMDKDLFNGILATAEAEIGKGGAVKQANKERGYWLRLLRPRRRRYACWQLLRLRNRNLPRLLRPRLRPVRDTKQSLNAEAFYAPLVAECSP
jgi:hypothetical protein